MTKYRFFNKDGPRHGVGSLFRRVFFGLAILVLSAPLARAGEVRVVDGDTLVLDGITYDLYGIDAPEGDQLCSVEGGSSPFFSCGAIAANELERLVKGLRVECNIRGHQDNGQVLAVCLAGDTELNRSMVRQGMAWAFREHSMDYVGDEERAKAEKLGIWSTDASTPWDYRDQKWAEAVEKSSGGCPIKGVEWDYGEKVYLLPWSVGYDSLYFGNCVWLCSERAALAAGWKAANWRHPPGSILSMGSFRLTTVNCSGP